MQLVALCQKWAFWLYFWNILTNFLKPCKNQLCFTYLFLNLSQYRMLITKNLYFFSFITNFEIFQKLSVKIKIFLHILIVPIMYETEKVKKVLGNKIGITIYSWTLCSNGFSNSITQWARMHLPVNILLKCGNPRTYHTQTYLWMNTIKNLVCSFQVSIYTQN